VGFLTWLGCLAAAGLAAFGALVAADWFRIKVWMSPQVNRARRQGRWVILSTEYNQARYILYLALVPWGAAWVFFTMLFLDRAAGPNAATDFAFVLAAGLALGLAGNAFLVRAFRRGILAMSPIECWCNAGTGHAESPSPPFGPPPLPARPLVQFPELEERYLANLRAEPDAFGPAARKMQLLAMDYEERDQLADAESLYRRALVLWEEVRGPAHPDVAEGLHQLGQLLLRLGREAEARELLTRAMAIWEQRDNAQPSGIC